MSALDEQQIDSLLGKLASDDSFRAEFSASPRRALASLGIAASVGLSLLAAPGQASAADAQLLDAPVKALASKAVFAASRQVIAREGKDPFVPVTLDFDKPAHK